jgi:hypothetical protein
VTAIKLQGHFLTGVKLFKILAVCSLLVVKEFINMHLPFYREPYNKEHVIYRTETVHINKYASDEQICFCLYSVRANKITRLQMCGE